MDLVLAQLADQRTKPLGPPTRPRAIVSWKLASDSIRWYLDDRALRMYGGAERVGEVDVFSKPVSAGQPINLPPSFRLVETVRLYRLTLNRYVSRHPMRLRFQALDALPTGFGENAVVIDAPPATRARLGAEARTAPSSPEEEG